MTNYSNPKQGGDLSDMAASGTSMPNDAGDLRTIPAVPHANQAADANDLGSADLAGAADNASDLPRSVRDTGLNTEIVTGTGDTLPAYTDSKRMHPSPSGVAGSPAAKGHPRDAKHGQQKGADQERAAGDGADVQDSTGSGDMVQDDMRDQIDAKE